MRDAGLQFEPIVISKSAVAHVMTNDSHETAGSAGAPMMAKASRCGTLVSGKGNYASDA